ncbi:lysine methyltransferase [Skeletonema marinoi]|uniref:Lysine methyltransferase n=1 Tax=Skeletonema marinoi TaxID=267567 RepID=A0AAD9D7K7_9STRA|nr:lysine methyltransferase [Skeletonema marinoi]
MTTDKLATLEDHLSSPRQISLTRIDYAAKRSSGKADGGLPAMLVSMLSDAHNSSIHLDGDNTPADATINVINEFCSDSSIDNLFRIISLLAKVSQLDNTLGEEISRAGSQAILKRLVDRIKEYITIYETSTNEPSEELLDKLMDYLDLTCELYSPTQARGMPFTNEEIERRLPLVYNLGPAVPGGEGGDGEHHDHGTTILISQVTVRQSSQGDVGYVMWPSAIVLSRWLLSNPQHILGKSVLEIGAGCGLVGIAAARLFAQSNCEKKKCVTITDVNDLVIDNIAKNIVLNDVSEVACVAKLDFYEQTGNNESGKWIEGFTFEYRDPVEVILAADIICQPSDAVAAAKTIYDALVPTTGRAYVVCADSEHRFGIEIFQEECERVGLEVTTTNVADMSEDLLSDCHSTSGYVDGMNLTFYEVQKK